MNKINFKITDFLISQKKQLIGFFLLLLLWCFSLNDFFLYQNTIVKINNVKTKFEETKTGPNEEQENYYTQTLKAIIKNGREKGKTITLENEYSDSHIRTDQYKKGETLFVELSENNGVLSGVITGVKRDSYLVLLIGLTFLILLAAVSKRGLLIIASLAMNTIIFIAWVVLEGESVYRAKNWYFLVIAFCIITLIFVSGFHRKTLAAILASFISTGLIYALYQFIAIYTDRPPYELMENIISPDSLETFFIISVIVGSLGAIMDVAVTITSSVSELVNTSEHIELGQLIDSIREIALDIMGTMINVLFFSYLSGSLFRIILELKNGYSIFALLHFSFIFEVIRFLAGSIGIVLTIPLAGFLSILLFWKRTGKQAEKKEKQPPIS